MAISTIPSTIASTTRILRRSIGGILVPRPVMPSSFWVASTKRCKDAGSVRSFSYGRDRGRGSAQRDRGPEAGMYCWPGHTVGLRLRRGMRRVGELAELGRQQVRRLLADVDGAVADPLD